MEDNLLIYMLRRSQEFCCALGGHKDQIYNKMKQEQQEQFHILFVYQSTNPLTATCQPVTSQQ